MQIKALAVQSVLEMTENRAKPCQPSERCLCLHARIGTKDREVYRKWLTTSGPYLILVIAGVLISLVNCGSGSSGSMGGGTPNPTPNAVPVISSITPPNASAGGAGLTIMVTGAGFVSTSTVNWNGAARTTAEVSDTQLTATVTAADIAAVGVAQITVVNPAPAADSGTSNSVGFIIAGTPGFLYVASSIGVSLTSGNISVFSIDPSTGSLTPVSGSPFPGGPQPTSVTVDPFGKFLYEASNIDNLVPAPVISAFTINLSTGALTSAPGSPFTAGTMPLSLSVDSTGKFLYTADFGGDNNNSPSPDSISEFSIDATTGVLTPISQAACPNNSFGLANAVVTDPIAGFLFVLSPDTSIAFPAGTVCTLSINSLGILQPVTGSPFSLGTASNTDPRALAVDPLGKFLYVGDNATSNLWAFSITPGGALDPVPGSPFSTGTFTSTSLAVDPLGRFLYVNNLDENISGFRINRSTGALSMLAGFPFNAQPAGTTALAMDPSGKFLYLISQAATVSAYAIDETTGALTAVAGSPFTVVDGTPQAVTVTRKAQ
jgi:6-phosphogluconolactonase